jgi:hypothetical protein
MPKRKVNGAPPGISVILPTELDLFSDRPQNHAVTSAEWLRLKPINSISGTSVGHLEFVSTGEASRYRNLENVYLRLRVRLTDGAGAALPSGANDAKVALINNSLHSMISSINCYMNGTDVAQSSDHYDYNAYIQTTLGFSALHSYERLSAEGHYPVPDKIFGTSNSLDETSWTTDLDTNLGLKWRYNSTKDGRVFELYGKLLLDISTARHYIPNNIDMRFKINLNDPTFSLIADKASTAKITIDDATLYTQVLSINPSLQLANERHFQLNKMSAHFKRTMLKQFVIPSGVRSYNLSNVWVGECPRLVLLVMVDQNAASGDILKNPMVFKHYSLNSIVFDVGGKQTKISGLDFTNGKELFTQAYVELYKALNLHRTSEATLSMFDYIYGRFILAADLSSTLEGLNHDYAPAPVGSLRIDAEFGTALPNAITVIVVGIFDSTLYIDRDRNVTYTI